MKTERNKWITLVLATIVASSAALAQTPYDEGQKALRDARWLEAADWFEQAADSGEAVDAAMYWRTHALYKAGRHGDAARQARLLERQFPDSRWTREAQALQIEYQGAGEQQNLDDEMRLFALSRLMDRDPQRAMPLVMDMLRDSPSEDVRRDAMFLLGMSELPEAHQAVADFARDGANPKLQMQAIQILGAAGTTESLKLLRELYASASGRQVKRSIIHAFIAADDPEPLVDMLRSETDADLQRDMLHALGAMDATGSLDAIYGSLTSTKARRAAIEAFSIAGDMDRLREVAQEETNAELQAAAITGIAVIGDSGAVELLRSLYDNASEASIRAAVVEALVIMDDGEDLALYIVRNDPEAEVRHQAIQVLGLLDATDRLNELYTSLDDIETRKAVLEAMMIADNTDGLLQIVETEPEAELRTQAIRMLASTGDHEAGEALRKIYPRASREEKQAIIEAMLIMDDVEALTGLLEQEDDPELKRYMLQMLSAMDSEEADEYLFQALERDR